jgi:hypothetical protein
MNCGLYQSARVDLPSDSTLLVKFRCHPTIPCDIPRTYEDLNALWYHIPDDLLPTNWSSDWFEISPPWFQPCSNYSMGTVDILLKTKYRIPYPIKGVMFCTVDRIEPGGLFGKRLRCGIENTYVRSEERGLRYILENELFEEERERERERERARERGDSIYVTV